MSASETEPELSPEPEPGPAWRLQTDAATAAAVERRLRRLSSLCSVPAAATLAAAGETVWELAQSPNADAMASPPAGAFGAVVVAMLLVLLSSAVRGRILRTCTEAEDEEAATAAEAAAANETATDGALEPSVWTRGAPRPSPSGALLRRLTAYTAATAACFGMLAVAAALGLWMAVAERAFVYGLMVAATSLCVMAVRWPGTAGFARAFPEQDVAP